MKVLITGSCGFLGSHICEFFLSEGWEVISLDNLTEYEFGRSGYKNSDARSYNYRFLKSLGIKTLLKDITKITNVKYNLGYIRLYNLDYIILIINIYNKYQLNNLNTK